MLAALPIVVILVLMLGFRWSAARAGAVGLATALALAWSYYGLGTTTLPELGTAKAAGGALGEALFTALTILWIIFPALCIHELQVRSGAVDVLRRAMARISGDPRILALLVAWFFVLFVEGAAGFGTSVALAAPFLVSAGFGRVAAVSMALIGHAVGVSFGAVGTPIIPQVAASGLSAREIAGTTAGYQVLIGWMMPLAVMLLAARALPGGERRPLLWGWTLFAASCFLLPYYLLARFVGPELPTLAGALFGAFAFVAVLRTAGKRPLTTVSVAAAAKDAGMRSIPPLASSDAAMANAMPTLAASTGLRAADLLRSAAPYLVLIALIGASRLITPLQQSLRSVDLAWSYAAFGGNIQILYHPGSMLLLSFVVGALWQRTSPAVAFEAVSSVMRRLLPVTLALVAMLGLSRVMVHAGMIDALAVAAAGAAGPMWPLLAPATGTLGTFVTGSATASNILFTEFQVATAKSLGLSVLGLTAAQGFGAAVGNIICPHNIVAASATVQLVGREGDVLRRTLLPGAVCALLGGILALLIFS